MKRWTLLLAGLVAATAQAQRPGQQASTHADPQTNQKQFPHWPALSAGS